MPTRRSPLVAGRCMVVSTVTGGHRPARRPGRPHSRRRQPPRLRLRRRARRHPGRLRQVADARRDRALGRRAVAGRADHARRRHGRAWTSTWLRPRGAPAPKPADPPAVLHGGRRPRAGVLGRQPWVAYRIGVSEAEREKLQDEKKPVRDKVWACSASTPPSPKPDPVVVPDVTRLAFAPRRRTSRCCATSRRARSAQGADLLVRNLATGADRPSFGNVVGLRVAGRGPPAGVHDRRRRQGRQRRAGLRPADRPAAAPRLRRGDVHRPRVARERRRPRVLPVAHRRRTSRTTRRSCSPGATSASAGGSARDEGVRPRGRQGLPRRHARRPVPAAAVGEGRPRALLRRPGMGQKPKKDAKEGGEAASRPDAKDAKPAPKEKPASVDVWHAKDERIIPMQRIDKSRDLEKHYASVWRIDEATWLRIGTDTDERVEVLDGDRFATETDRKPYLFDNMFDRTRQDVYVVDLATGARTKAIEGVWYFHGASPAAATSCTSRVIRYWTYERAHGQEHEHHGGAEGGLDQPRLRHARSRAAAAVGRGRLAGGRCRRAALRPARHLARRRRTDPAARASRKAPRTRSSTGTSASTATSACIDPTEARRT